MQKISLAIDKVLRRAIAGKDDQLAELILNWHKMASVNLARQSRPKKIMRRKNEKNLLVTVDNSASALELRYQQNYILEKVTLYFGYKVIDKIIIKLL